MDLHALFAFLLSYANVMFFFVFIMFVIHQFISLGSCVNLC